MRWCPALALIVLAACSGHGATLTPEPTPDEGEPTQPSAIGSAAPASPDTERSDTVPPDTVPPAAVPDSVLDRELVEELRLAADSAADEALLDQLASTRLDSLGSDEPAADDAGPSGPEATSGRAVHFDIDVESFNSHARVQYWLNFFQTLGRERMAVWLTRMPRYEAMIRRTLQAHDLPGDLVYLALIESGFSNTATSPARAVGMWQFMKGTAKHYQLRIDRWVDERRDPYRATVAAARHLRDLYERFGSYYLAAAAYNAGAGRVSRGLSRLPDDEADSAFSDATFFRLYDTRLLRQETKDYVPKLIAAAMIAKEPERYGFAPPPADDLPPYDSLVVTGMTGLDVIARLADTTLAAIRELNPQYLRLVTPPGTRSVVRLPPGKGAQTAVAYAELPPSRRVSYVEHVVRKGETLSGIARRYRVSVRDIEGANPRVKARRLRPGQRLIVPTMGRVSGEVARQLAAAESATSRSSAAKARRHVVRAGDTLSGLARRYGVSIRALRRANNLRSDLLRRGTVLRIPAGG